MVQVFSVEPTMSTAGLVGQAIGQGLAKRAGIAEAEQAFQDAQGDPLKLATAFARLTSVSPELARGAGTMYEAMMKGMQAKAAGQQYPGGQEQYPESTQRLIQQYAQDQQQPPQEAPGLTTRESTQEILRPTMPMTRDQIMARGVQLFQRNPMLFENDINQAIQAAENENLRNLQRSQAIQAAGQAQMTSEQNLKNELRALNDRWGGGELIPENVYNKFQNEAIKSMLPINEGGEGLTQQEATQKYIPKLEEIARDYKALDDLGDWTFVWGSAESALTNIKNIRKKFKKNDDLENFADYMIGHNDLSPRMAYSLAYPIEEDPNVYNEVKKLKKLDPVLSTKSPKKEGVAIIDRIVSKMTPDSSPLAIANYLSRKGYDPQPFLDYLVENQDQLGLTVKQARQLNRGSQLVPKINDLWIMSTLGIE